MHLGLFKVLAGDLSHSRSVSRSVRPLYFFIRIMFQFDQLAPFPRGLMLLH